MRRKKLYTEKSLLKSNWWVVKGFFNQLFSLRGHMTFIVMAAHPVVESVRDHIHSPLWGFICPPTGMLAVTVPVCFSHGFSAVSDVWIEPTQRMGARSVDIPIATDTSLWKHFQKVVFPLFKTLLIQQHIIFRKTIAPAVSLFCELFNLTHSGWAGGLFSFNMSGMDPSWQVFTVMFQALQALRN